MTMRTVAVAVMLWVLAGVAGAQEESNEEFVGWSKDGSYWVKKSDDQQGAGLYFCATDPWTTPKWTVDKHSERSPGSSEWCVRYDGEPDSTDAPPKGWEANIVKAAGLPKLPAGITLTRDKKVNPKLTLWLVKSPAGTGYCDIADTGKVRKYFLRADGKALAVERESPPGGYGVSESFVAHCDLAHLWNDVATGDRKGATAANGRGMKAYHARKWAEAATAFAEAVKLDDSYPLGHYDLASVSAIVGDLPVVRRELAWMVASHHLDAIRLLASTSYDHDLDAAMVDPEVRRLLGGSVTPEGTRDLLFARGGVFSHEAVACTAPAVLLVFGPSRSFDVTVTPGKGCKGKPEKAKGQWEQGEKYDTDPVTLKGGKTKTGPVLDGVKIMANRCQGAKADGGCLRVLGSELLLHPGQPELAGSVYQY